MQQDDRSLAYSLAGAVVSLYSTLGAIALAIAFAIVFGMANGTNDYDDPWFIGMVVSGFVAHGGLLWMVIAPPQNARRWIITGLLQLPYWAMQLTWWRPGKLKYFFDFDVYVLAEPTLVVSFGVWILLRQAMKNLNSIDGGSMQDIEARAKQAESLWSQGDAALAGGDAAKAYKLYTEAHDLVTDCARLHERAHVHLRTVTRLHADRREYFTDTLLLALAPFGVFRLLEIYFRSKVGGAEVCRGRA